MKCQEITNLIIQASVMFHDFGIAFRDRKMNEATIQKRKIDDFLELNAPERPTDWTKAELLDKIDILSEENKPMTAIGMTKINKKVWVNVTFLGDSWKDLILQLRPRNKKREKIVIDVLEKAEDFTDNIVQLNQDFIAITLFGSKWMTLVDLKKKEIIQESSFLEGDSKSIIFANGWLVNLRSSHIYAWKVDENGNIGQEADIHKEYGNIDPVSEVVPVNDSQFAFFAHSSFNGNQLKIFTPEVDRLEEIKLDSTIHSAIRSIAVLSDNFIVVATEKTLYLVTLENGSASRSLIEENLTWKNSKLISLPDGIIIRGLTTGEVIVGKIIDNNFQTVKLLKKTDLSVDNLCYADGVLYSSHIDGTILKWGETHK